jgi:hypothetical protein
MYIIDLEANLRFLFNVFEESYNKTNALFGTEYESE